MNIFFPGPGNALKKFSDVLRAELPLHRFGVECVTGFDISISGMNPQQGNNQRSCSAFQYESGMLQKSFRILCINQTRKNGLSGNGIQACIVALHPV